MPSSLSIARELAYDALVLVMEKKEPARRALELMIQKNDKKIKKLDRDFVKDMLYGSLRWHSKLFWILQNTSKRNLMETSPEIRAALVAGTFQIYYMERVPDRTAVNESVEYVRKKGQASACSFVNGILRQISRRAEYFQKPDKESRAVEYLALQFAHPEWLIRRWLKQFRQEKLEGILASHNQKPPITVRANCLKTELSQIRSLQQKLLKEEKVHTDKRPLRTALVFNDSPRFGGESLYQQGFYTFEDEAAQLVGLVTAPEEGQTIANAWAGDGQYLTHLFESSEGKCSLTGLETEEDRFMEAQENSVRLGQEGIKWLKQDFNTWKPDKTPDKILLIPPSSQLGRLRRAPEIKWQLSEEQFNAYAKGQRESILHALSLMKPGGELVYAVLSFEKEEVEDHLVAVKERFGDAIEVVSPVARLPDYYKKYVTRENILLVYSGNQDGMDGLGSFIIRLKAKVTI